MSGFTDIAPDVTCMLCDHIYDTVVGSFPFCITHAEEIMRDLFFGRTDTND